ncbi:MAG: hypothetical protein JWO63_1591 [Frankiales bacterium]|nr:hypothetical protein [Frankiales bacterium]
MPLDPEEEKQLLAIEAQLMAESPDLDRILGSRLTRRRKTRCWLVICVGTVLMALGFILPVLITIGFLLSATAFVVLIGPCLLATPPPLNHGP